MEDIDPELKAELEQLIAAEIYIEKQSSVCGMITFS